MQRQKKRVFSLLLFTGVILFLILLLQPVEIVLFHKDIALLFPKGPIALEERNLLLLIQGLMLLVIIPVYVLTFIFSWRYRADNKKAIYDPDLVDHKIAELIWWGVPIVIVAIIGVVTWVKTYELDPFKPIQSTTKEKTIQVVALQWKWLFIYPEENIATVNYLQIPKDTPIHFEITADAPMNSFWIPALGGQIYAMPGMKTELYLLANEEGEFRGSSANISGEGFASMHFVTKASNPDDYLAFVQSVKEKGGPLNQKTYTELSLPSIDDKIGYYKLEDDGLFHQILMKFMKMAEKN